MAALRRRLLAQADVFDEPGTYRAGVGDALDAVDAILVATPDPSRRAPAARHPPTDTARMPQRERSR